MTITIYLPEVIVVLSYIIIAMTAMCFIFYGKMIVGLNNEFHPIKGPLYFYGGIAMLSIELISSLLWFLL